MVGIPDAWLPREIPRPSFSLAERDRRWAAVRQLMAQEGLDGVIAPGTEDDADAVYLTQIGGRTRKGWIVFPQDARKPTLAIVENRRGQDFWSSVMNWLAPEHYRVAAANISESLIGAIRELGLEAGSWGVTQLTGIGFDPEGLIPFTTFDRLRAALPRARFVATDAVHRARMIKGAEEIEILKKIVAVNEEALKTLIEAARRPAKTQAELWFPTYLSLFLATGELPTRLSMALDRGGNSTLGTPTSDAVLPGQILSEEIAANCQGYRAQINHSLFIGNEGLAGFDYYKKTLEVSVQLFHAVADAIRPGKTTTGDLIKRYAEAGNELGVDSLGGVIIHSSGIGNQRPRVGPITKHDLDIVIRPGMTFDIKPAITMRRDRLRDAGPKNRSVQIGDQVLVTETGAVRLGKRPLEPIATAD
ncbi:MAG TPA: M24 family metallopeptidase [Candidatus Acidoferrales bacterium]|nr:M24 family metallopeptidase [Candidatus Acidoferrales bacterium]